MAVLREAQPADLPELVFIYNWAVRNTTATFDIEEQTLAQRQEWFNKHTAQYPIIVAEEEGKVIGFSSLSPFHEKEGYAKTVEISVYIERDFWGKGLGKQLLEEIIHRARGLGYHSIMALITADNAASIRLHERFGFRQVGHLREVGYKFDRWLDVLFYQLIL